MSVTNTLSPIDFSSMVHAALNHSVGGGGGGGSNYHRRMHLPSNSEAVIEEAAEAARSALAFGGSNCFNATIFDYYIRGVVKNLTTLSRAQRREIEGDPLVYIVAVLIFYSCGIVVLLINYMKKEQNDLEETKLYKQYMEKRDRYDEFNNRGRCLNKLALQALNAVNVISQDDQTTRVAFV